MVSGGMNVEVPGFTTGRKQNYARDALCYRRTRLFSLAKTSFKHQGKTFDNAGE